MNAPPKVHIRYLDGIRGLAALFVVAGHGFITVWNFFERHELPPEPLRPFLMWLLYGRFAVDLFIVLSGYCLMLPVLRAGGVIRGGAIDFYKRRAWRILPTYYAALALSLVLGWTVVGRKTGTHWDICLPIDGESIASCLLMLQDVWRPFRINHAFWSIAVEWRIYFLLPALVWAWRRIGPAATTIAATLASVALVMTLRRLHLPTFTIEYVALFVFGMLAATIGMAEGGRMAALRDRFPWGLASAVAAMAVVGGCAWKGIDAIVMQQARVDLVVGLGWAVILVYLATPRGGWLTALLAWRPLVYCGVIGYSLYLIHAPLIQVLHQYVFLPMGPGKVALFALQIVVGIPVIVAAASGFAYLFEPRSRAVVEVPAAPRGPATVEGARPVAATGG